MADKFYCKWCGVNHSNVSSLVNNNCSRNPNGNKHELYEGREKDQYICKYCGYKSSTISNLTNNVCSKSPNKRHHPAM